MRGLGPNNALCVPMAQVAQDHGEAMTEIFELRQDLGEDTFVGVIIQDQRDQFNGNNYQWFVFSKVCQSEIGNVTLKT